MNKKQMQDEVVKALATFGRAVAAGGKFVGTRAADGWRAIDPDVKRHFAQFPLLSYSLFVSRTETIDPGQPDGHPPLIFVHGLGGNRGNFLLMAWYLYHRGRKRSYKIHFDLDQSIEDMARALAKFIRDVRKATGEKQVDVVSHSLGGIISRLAITDHRLGGSVRSLVTLGTPHHGTYSARFASTEKTIDLRVGSEFMKKMEGKPLPKTIKCVSFWSRNDIVILPSESAVLESGDAVEMTPLTHFSYLIDPRSWGAVADALARAE
jgi:triacylglycerol esterase/lipase EstA (alpha/beta hydrolase family)